MSSSQSPLSLTALEAQLTALEKAFNNVESYQEMENILSALKIHYNDREIARGVHPPRPFPGIRGMRNEDKLFGPPGAPVEETELIQYNVRTSQVEDSLVGTEEFAVLQPLEAQHSYAQSTYEELIPRNQRHETYFVSEASPTTELRAPSGLLLNHVPEYFEPEGALRWNSEGIKQRIRRTGQSHWGRDAYRRTEDGAWDQLRVDGGWMDPPYDELCEVEKEAEDQSGKSEEEGRGRKQVDEETLRVLEGRQDDLGIKVSEGR